MMTATTAKHRGGSIIITFDQPIAAPDASAANVPITIIILRRGYRCRAAATNTLYDDRRRERKVVFVVVLCHHHRSFL
jgi:hypothetical protein